MAALGAHEQLAGPGDRAQARGRVDRVAEGGEVELLLPAADGPDIGDAGVDADPDGQLRQSRARVPERRLEAAPGGDGVRGMLLATEARDEEGDDAVTHELVDDAARAVDRLGRTR